MNKKENITDSEEIILEILEAHDPLTMQQIIQYAGESGNGRTARLRPLSAA